MFARGKWFALIGIATVGCSGSSVATGGTSGTSGSVSSGGGSGSPSTALVGTWDLTSAVSGKDGTGVLTITPTSLVIQFTSFAMTADASGASPAVNAVLDGRGGDLATTHNAEPLDLGQIPYGVGGTWIFQGSQADRCNVTARAQFVSIDCSNLTTPLRDNFHGWDYDNGKPLSTGLTTAQRQSKLDSQFGEAGGEWQVVLPQGNCKVKIADNTFHANCTLARRSRSGSVSNTGTITLTFTDGFASGTTNAGEVSAKRR